MIDATHIRKNMILKMEDGQLWRVVEMQLITPGRWKAMVQTKLRSLRDNSVKDHRFRSVDRVEQIHLDDVEMEFLYQNGDEYVFMNHQTYDQVQLTAEAIGDSVKYLVPNVIFTIEMLRRPADQRHPADVHGDEGRLDRAVDEGGHGGRLLQAGDHGERAGRPRPALRQRRRRIRIDTREDKYLERVK